MEAKFQTSFIPKNNFTPAAPQKPPHKTSLFTVVIIVLFVVILALAGAAFGYAYYLQHQVNQSQANLKSELSQLSSSNVDTLASTDGRLKAASSLLAGHLALSQIFTFLSNSTLQNVRFSSFSYSTNSNTGQTIISMSGQAASFADVALQAAEFSSPASAKYIQNPIISGLGLDQYGNVGFSFTADVVTSAFAYHGIPGVGATTTSATTTSAGTNPTS